MVKRRGVIYIEIIFCLIFFVLLSFSVHAVIYKGSYWNFNEGAGDTAHDSWKGNNASAIEGGNLKFARVSPYYNITGNGGFSSIDLSTAISSPNLTEVNNTNIYDPSNTTTAVSFWFYPWEDDRLISNGGDYGGERGIDVKTSLGAILIKIRTNFSFYTSYVQNFNHGEWNHFAMVIEDTDDVHEVTVYINGKNETTISRTVQSNTLMTQTMAVLGRRTGETGSSSNLIDELRIYNQSLNFTQIQLIYNFGLELDENYSYVILDKPNNSDILNHDVSKFNFTIYSNENIINVSLLTSDYSSESYGVHHYYKEFIARSTNSSGYGGRWYGRPKIEEAADGTWVMVYRNSTQHGQDVDETTHNIIFSSDEGSNWTTPNTYLNGSRVEFFPYSATDDGGNPLDAKKSELIVAPNGDLLLTFKLEDSSTIMHESNILRSTDNGFTWTDGGNLTWADKGDLPYAIVMANDHVIVGDVIYTTGRTSPGNNGYVARSRDNGQTWELVSTLYISSNEVGIEQLNDTTLITVARTGVTNTTTVEYVYPDLNTTSGPIDLSDIFGGGEVHSPVLVKFSDGLIRMSGRKYEPHWNSVKSRSCLWITSNGTYWNLVEDCFEGYWYDAAYTDVIEKSDGSSYFLSYRGSQSGSNVIAYSYSDTNKTYDNFEIVATNSSADINTKDISFDLSDYTQNEWYSWKIQLCTENQCVESPTNREFKMIAVSTPPPLSSGGGGGSSSSSSSTSKVRKGFVEKSWDFVSKDETISFIVKDKEISVYNVELKSKKDSKNVKVNIGKINYNPTSYDPKGKIHSYLEIKKENLESENIFIKFKVEKSWVDENNLDKKLIYLNRYTNEWERLDTNFLEEDSYYYYYETYTSGLSYFSISGEECTSNESRCYEENLQKCYEGEWVYSGECEKSVSSLGSTKKPINITFYFYIFLAVIIIFLLILLSIFLFKNKSKIIYKLRVKFYLNKAKMLGLSDKQIKRYLMRRWKK